MKGAAALAALLLACQPPVEMRGLYVHYDNRGALLPCDQPDSMLVVNDSALAASYAMQATAPYQRLFVRLRGVRADSGSIYGGAHHFLVRRILEIRPSRATDCPRLATPVPLPAVSAVPARRGH